MLRFWRAAPRTWQPEYRINLHLGGVARPPQPSAIKTLHAMCHRVWLAQASRNLFERAAQQYCCVQFVAKPNPCSTAAIQGHAEQPRMWQQGRVSGQGDAVGGAILAFEQDLDENANPTWPDV